MYFVFNLAFPAIVAIIIIATNGHAEWSFTWFDKSLGSLGNDYVLFALPHWIWASATSYFNSSDGATIGGFIGLHALLVSVSILVASSNSPDAVNGWFFYYFSSPIVIAVGALAGRKICQWRANNGLTPHSNGSSNGAP